MTQLLSPPITPPAALVDTLRRQGHATLAPAGLAELAALELPALEAWMPSWDRLPPDAYLRDGGRYRRRRHGSFVASGEDLRQVAHRAHWQPESYNALHGGLERWFEPLETALVADPAWKKLLVALAAVCSAQKDAQPWYVEAHQFRIDTEGGIGRPTPEGAHRDGVDFVAVILVAREGVKGGESRVFEAEGPSGLRFTLTQPWTTLLLDDERVIHETTPIQPSAPGGHRDTLVLTFRAHGFQDPQPTR
ncbi:2OG-Fe dioxygenase family protein [uncultured Piscinibacter sp.]|uniref:2OG-Fe dioxygenase family protein n=1 Tax=uncultured Piscinibacter sp. TaxID=1131835 RepID=UPI00260CE928|nr:2OG-Fe dioxygenase family protein [uncultured Piscinibacter sp.]